MSERWQNGCDALSERCANIKCKLYLDVIICYGIEFCAGVCSIGENKRPLSHQWSEWALDVMLNGDSNFIDWKMHWNLFFVVESMFVAAAGLNCLSIGGRLLRLSYNSV